MCLGDWSTHSEKTGGFFRCTIYKPDPEDQKKRTKEEQDFKRLEFYVEKFITNKSAYNKEVANITNYKKTVYESKNNNVAYRLNKTIPGILDFYYES